jgi:cell division protein FtsL
MPARNRRRPTRTDAASARRSSRTSGVNARRTAPKSGRGARRRSGSRRTDTARRIAVSASEAGRTVARGAKSAGRLTVVRAEAAGREIAKQGRGLPRRMSGIASSLHARGLILWGAALATGLVCVWQHVHSTELASQIEALRDTREAIQTEIGLLEMECVELSRRERVEDYASERLGMRYPRAGEVVWLTPGGAEGISGRPEDYVEENGNRDTEG